MTLSLKSNKDQSGGGRERREEGFKQRLIFRGGCGGGRMRERRKKKISLEGKDGQHTYIHIHAHKHTQTLCMYIHTAQLDKFPDLPSCYLFRRPFISSKSLLHQCHTLLFTLKRVGHNNAQAKWLKNLHPLFSTFTIILCV